MRHRVKKIKFKSGQDASTMLVRKLVRNFLTHGKITTTYKRAKAIKTIVEKLISKAKMDKAGVVFADIAYPYIDTLKLTVTGGYVRLIRLNQRESDGADMVRVSWIYPFIIEDKKTANIKRNQKKLEKIESKRSRKTS